MEVRAQHNHVEARKLEEGRVLTLSFGSREEPEMRVTGEKR